MYHLLTVVDGNQQAQAFATMSEAVAYILRHPQATFTIYAAREIYRETCKRLIDQENREDYDSIYHYGTMKSSITSWGDLNDFDDMIEDSEERIRKRKRECEQRLSYGGEQKE